MSALLLLVPWYWRWLAFVALIAAAMAFGAAKMHEHDQRAYDELVADLKAERKAMAEVEADRTRQSDALLAEKDKKHDEDLALADAYWSAYAAGLQQPAGAVARAKPVPVSAKICNDEARDRELSGAIQRSEQDLGRAIAQYRAGLAPLLGGAEVQAADLLNLQDAWARERVINGGR